MITRQIRSWLDGAALASTFLPISPTLAQSVDELKRQLEAQQQINAQLRQHVLTLEETVERLQEENDALAGNSVTQTASE